MHIERGRHNLSSFPCFRCPSHTFPEVGVKVCNIVIGRDLREDPFSADELKIKVAGGAAARIMYVRGNGNREEVLDVNACLASGG